MADKLSWTELRKALASRAGANEREARTFLEALNIQIIEGLRQDKQVKINGIGTFRLQTVAPRESVNVTTGERITIEQYEKIAFSAEAGMKELIEHNTPMKKQNTKKAAEEVNPLKKLGEQATEIVDILADMGQSPTEEPKKAPKAKPAKKTTKTKAAAQKVKEPKAEVVTPIETVEEPAAPVVEEQVVAPVVVETPAEPVDEEEQAKVEGSYHFLRDTVICIVVLLMLLLLGYFFLRHQISDWFNALNAPHQVEMSEVVEPKKPAKAEAPATIDMPEVYEEIRYTQFITTEPMHQHSRLAWMAWRYYGNKDFWVYLYDANKDHITNPDKIMVGTPIRVPRLTAEQMDTTSPKTRKTLQRLTEQGEAAKLR